MGTVRNGIEAQSRIHRNLKYYMYLYLRECYTETFDIKDEFSSTNKFSLLFAKGIGKNVVEIKIECE